MEVPEVLLPVRRQAAGTDAGIAGRDHDATDLLRCEQRHSLGDPTPHVVAGDHRSVQTFSPHKVEDALGMSVDTRVLVSNEELRDVGGDPSV